MCTYNARLIKNGTLNSQIDFEELLCQKVFRHQYHRFFSRWMIVSAQHASHKHCQTMREINLNGLTGKYRFQYKMSKFCFFFILEN